MKENLLIHQEMELPAEYDIKDFKLFYRDIDLLRLSKKYGTPLRFTFLPSILEKIDAMKTFFKEVIEETGYQGAYTYYYCTKSSHFQHIVSKAIQSNIGIEISSAYDIDLIKSLIDDGNIKAGAQIICNGYKTPRYQDGIISLIQQNHCSVLPVIDSKSELQYYLKKLDVLNNIEIGMRLNLSFLTSYVNESRFGLSPKDILTLFENDIQTDKRIALTTLHFFNENGMAESDDYWDVLEEVVRFYCKLKRLNPYLTTLDIGGGMPFRSDTDSNFDIRFLVQRIVKTIQDVCQTECVREPHIITEFGKYTVAEATATIFKIHEKKRGGSVNWAIIDGSFITHLPDTWAIRQEYPVLPVNNLQEEQSPFILGGLTCDSADFYPNSNKTEFVMLPDSNEEQYITFLHTGAYQEALSGFGGVNHCLIPSLKHIIIDTDIHNNLQFSVFAEKQTSDNVLKILGYR